ncbi:hypothetical protein XENOCAPTIV_010511, partial [Xenoophorus captivus]
KWSKKEKISCFVEQNALLKTDGRKDWFENTEKNNGGHKADESRSKLTHIKGALALCSAVFATGDILGWKPFMTLNARPELNLSCASSKEEHGLEQLGAAEGNSLFVCSVVRRKAVT